MVRQALSQAFTDSQYGTPQAHEEGGYIWADRNSNFMFTRVPPGNPASTGQMRMRFPTTSTPMAPANGFALVGTFHTHPYYQGQPVTGMRGYAYGNPARPSAEDRQTTNQRGVPDIIVYRDRRGNIRTRVYGPARNSYCF